MTPMRAALRSQYQASLRMLQSTIENCPESLWTDGSYANPFWAMAYHNLFFTHLYLMQNEAAFRPWEKHRKGAQSMELARAQTPYTRAEILEYCQFCIELVDRALQELDLEHPDSGFSWYQVPKLEHQIVNIRHIQHHTAQLADRLRNDQDQGTPWAKKG